MTLSHLQHHCTTPPQVELKLEAEKWDSRLTDHSKVFSFLSTQSSFFLCEIFVFLLRSSSKKKLFERRVKKKTLRASSVKKISHYSVLKEKKKLSKDLVWPWHCVRRTPNTSFDQVSNCARRRNFFLMKQKPLIFQWNGKLLPASKPAHFESWWNLLNPYTYCGTATKRDEYVCRNSIDLLVARFLLSDRQKLNQLAIIERRIEIRWPAITQAYWE